LDLFTAIACLLGITALLSFANDRYLHLQANIGLLLTAVALTAALRLVELFVPLGVIFRLEKLTTPWSRTCCASCCFAAASSGASKMSI